jgi:hypothetical protein
MILINSNITDETTNLIIDWLDRFQAFYIRINANDKLLVRKAEISNKKINIEIWHSSNDQVINFSEVPIHARGV